jgi:hypothetical protein
VPMAREGTQKGNIVTSSDQSPVAARPRYWTIKHFSLANRRGNDQDNVPMLLRSVAAELESLGKIRVHEITYKVETNEDGYWPSLTIYFDHVA